MGLSGPKSNPGNRMPEPSSHQLGSCLASGCLPGEHILAWAPGRRKGPGLDLPGTLICTNFRVTFQPCGWQRKQDTPLSSENDFALINIGRLEAGKFEGLVKGAFESLPSVLRRLRAGAGWSGGNAPRRSHGHSTLTLDFSERLVKSAASPSWVSA